MPTSESTCWTVIRAAAAGSPAEREELARRYLGVVRSYLAARWHGTALREELDDATQEVFVECFRQGGVLDAAGSGRVPGFRAFLYGVIRNVARRFESRPVRAADPLPEIATDDASQSRLFDRTWAQAIMAEAGRVAAQRGRKSAGPRPSNASSCCGCGSRKTCRSGTSPSAGAPIRRPSTSPTPLPEKSFDLPSWRSSRSIIRAARSSWKRKRRAS